MNVRRILVPIDDTPMSRDVISQAVKIAKKSKFATITLLHVIDIPTSFHHPLSVQHEDDWKEKQITLGENLLEQQVKSMPMQYHQVKTTLLSGNLPYAIVDYAEKTGQDLIIMGRRKLSTIQKLFTSHVSDRVSSLTSIPVMKIYERSNIVSFPVSS